MEKIKGMTLVGAGAREALRRMAEVLESFGQTPDQRVGVLIFAKGSGDPECGHGQECQSVYALIMDWMPDKSGQMVAHLLYPGAPLPEGEAMELQAHLMRAAGRSLLDFGSGERATPTSSTEVRIHQDGERVEVPLRRRGETIH